MLCQDLHKYGFTVLYPLYLKSVCKVHFKVAIDSKTAPGAHKVAFPYFKVPLIYVLNSEAAL